MTIIRNNGGGRFLSEALPDLFEGPGMSETEQLCWCMYFEELENNRAKK